MLLVGAEWISSQTVDYLETGFKAFYTRELKAEGGRLTTRLVSKEKCWSLFLGFRYRCLILFVCVDYSTVRATTFWTKSIELPWSKLGPTFVTFILHSLFHLLTRVLQLGLVSCSDSQHSWIRCLGTSPLVVLDLCSRLL